MARQSLNVGVNSNDGTGDDLRSAMQKIESNFVELYADQTAIEITTDSIGATATDTNFIITTSGTGRLVTSQGIVINQEEENSSSTFIAIDGTSQLFVDPQTKRIGVNTSSPTSELSVVGDVNITQSLTVSGEVVISGTTTFNNTIISDIIPYTSGFDLGSVDTAWNTGYVNTLNGVNVVLSGSLLGNVTGNVTGNLAGNVTTALSGSVQFRNGIYNNLLTSSSLTASRTVRLPDASGTIAIITNSRLQSPYGSAPTTAVGSSSDKQGYLAFDDDYVYYCNADYDGSTSIWKRALLSTW